MFQVIDPIAMTTIIAVSGVALIFIVVVMVTTVCYCRSSRRRCCAKKRLTESETSFYPYTIERETLSRQPSVGLPQTIDTSQQHFIANEHHHHHHHSQVLDQHHLEQQDITVRPDEPDLIYRAARKREPTYPLPPGSQFALNQNNNNINHTNLRTPR